MIRGIKAPAAENTCIIDCTGLATVCRFATLEDVSARLAPRGLSIFRPFHSALSLAELPCVGWTVGKEKSEVSVIIPGKGAKESLEEV